MSTSSAFYDRTVLGERSDLEAWRDAVGTEVSWQTVECWGAVHERWVEGRSLGWAEELEG